MRGQVRTGAVSPSLKPKLLPCSNFLKIDDADLLQFPRRPTLQSRPSLGISHLDILNLKKSLHGRNLGLNLLGSSWICNLTEEERFVVSRAHDGKEKWPIA